MPRRISFAEVSRAVTRKVDVKSEMKRLSSSVSSSILKRKDTSRSLKNSDTPQIQDIQEQNTPQSFEPDANTGPDKAQEEELEVNTVSLAEDLETTAEAVAVEEGGNDAQVVVLGENDVQIVVLGGNDAQVVVLGEESSAEDGDGDDEDEEKKENDNKEEKTDEGETGRKVGWLKKLTKKQLRLQEEQLEMEEEREECRKRREDRRRKKELQAQLAQREGAQSFDEVAYKETIYTMVKNSLGLVMTQGDLNITVDNLTPAMKSLELDSGNEDVKDLIMEALLESYGLIEPSRIDSLIMKKKLENELDDLEDCVEAAFAIIDQDRDGIITHNDVYRLMIHLGEVLWDNQVTAMVQAADMDGDGRISKKDLFLFLLGQKKTVKVVDHTLNKYDSKDAEADAPVPSISSDNPAKEEPPASPQQDETTGSSASESSKSLAIALKAAARSEYSKASERRRKMFSGYSKLVLTANRVNNSATSSSDLSPYKDDSTAMTPDILDKDDASGAVAGEKADSGAVVISGTTAKEDSVVSRGGNSGASLDETVKNAPANTEALEPDQEEAEKQNLTNHEEMPPEMEESLHKEQENVTLLLPSNLASNDWSDSGHVVSDGEDDKCANSDVQLECAPMALETDIRYLPTPEFDTVASPDSTRTPRSAMSSSSCETPSPRPANQEPWQDQDANATSACLTLADLDSDHADPLTSARTECTSEEDSERDGDGDSLPETSHQNLILQVPHTQEALKTRKPNLEGVSLKDKDAAMITNDSGDGCEFLVESEIPPCARYAKNWLKLSLEYAENVHRTREDRMEADPTVGGSELCIDKDQQLNVDTLTVDEYANSTAEIVSKGYVSFSSPRSASTIMTKLPLKDITDDVFFPLTSLVVKRMEI